MRKIVTQILLPFMKWHMMEKVGLNDFGMGREVGGRFKMRNTCTPAADSC